MELGYSPTTWCMKELQQSFKSKLFVNNKTGTFNAKIEPMILFNM